MVNCTKLDEAHLDTIYTIKGLYVPPLSIETYYEGANESSPNAL